MKPLTLVLILLLFCPAIHSQESDTNYYKAFDSIVGIENTNLLNGTQFIDKYRSTETNNRFFKSYEFLNGSIVYDSQLYNNLKIKYDLHKDQIVLELPNKNNYFQLNINTDKVKQFTIDKHVFINYSNNNTSLNALEINGFLEPIFKGNNIELFIKHFKSRKESIKGSRVESDFKLKSQFLYLYKEKFYLLKSKNKLKKVFPKQADSINEYYKNNSILFKRNPNDFMLKLFKLIDSQNQ